MRPNGSSIAGAATMSSLPRASRSAMKPIQRTASPRPRPRSSPRQRAHGHRSSRRRCRSSPALLRSAQVAHQILNTGTMPMRYLSLTTLVELDACEYAIARSARCSWFRSKCGTPALRKMFRAENTVDYYEREELVARTSPCTAEDRSRASRRCAAGGAGASSCRRSRSTLSRPSAPAFSARSGMRDSSRSPSMPPSMITCATWMPCGPNSRAIDWTSSRSPPLVALKAANAAGRAASPRRR